VVTRGEVYWANLGVGLGRRPALILTRSAAIPLLHSVTVAPITRRTRGIASEVVLGREEGLPTECVANCDNLLTVRQDVFDPSPVGELGPAKVAALDASLRFALGIHH
jgi:mRNA interferase MazF